ncbi:MAG TPA: hypothetical protein VIR32_02550, partial [Lachnospiraceae bacterium]
MAEKKKSSVKKKNSKKTTKSRAKQDFTPAEGLKEDIILLVILLFSVLIFISNLGIGGVAGA